MKRTLVFLASCGLLLCGCGSTKARPGIANDRRLGAVTLGESKHQVAQALGSGVPRVIDANEAVYYPDAEIYVGYTRPFTSRSIAVTMLTRSPKYRTAAGLGVGTTLRQLRSRMAVHCGHQVVAFEVYRCSRSGNPNLAKPSTNFDIDLFTNRVAQIAIAAPHVIP